MLKEVDVKTYSDVWRPWRQKGKTQKKVLELDKNERCVKKAFNESVLKDTQNKKTVDWGAMGVYWDKSKADSECLNRTMDIDVIEASKEKEAGELSLSEKKKYGDIWRKGLLERLEKENVPVGHWGDTESGNFRCMIGECAPHGVRFAVIKELGFKGTDDYLYNELMKFYDKG